MNRTWRRRRLIPAGSVRFAVTGEGLLVITGGLLFINCLAWEFMCRVVPIVFVCAVVLAGVVGVLWLIGRVPRALGGK